MVSAWVYDHKYMSDDFNYDDLESQYLQNQTKNTGNSQSIKEQLDQAHRM